MKVIDNCPICNEKLLGNKERFNGGNQKWCPAEGQMFWCRLSYNGLSIVEMELHYANMPVIDWDFEERSLWAGRYTSSEIRLPFFDFDADNMPKLLEKLKTYIVFA